MGKIEIIHHQIIQQKIYYIRGEKVMFDSDLAELYEIKTKVLVQAVKRNTKRFPEDFMFQLTKRESDIFLRSQNVTSKRGGRRYFPYVFTEQGVAMLSTVLRSKRAIQVNIQIIRIFTQLRKFLTTHKELREKIEQMENKYDKRFKAVFETLKLLIREDNQPKGELGFKFKK
ncbi:MAG: ORF6N domain-containing protein [Candidatus Moraniibacteriota bacterium]